LRSPAAAPSSYFASTNNETAIALYKTVGRVRESVVKSLRIDLKSAPLWTDTNYKWFAYLKGFIIQKVEILSQNRLQVIE
ncbi:MAG: hypothetical protein ACC645_24245, partial [Pirellulales bacterium]